MTTRMIGANIRSLREAGGLTVTELAQRADLTKGTVSKIETGRVSPPIATLTRLADALDVPLADFFIEPSPDPAFVLTRKGQGRILTRDGTRFGYSYEGLALERRHKRAEPFVLTIRPGDPPADFQHGGEEFIYMLSGRMAFHVGEEEMTLAPGDALYFDPHLKHGIRLIGKRPARFLCLFIQDRGERSSARRKP